MTSNMTSIEEIVKYQQELLNYQRNQKQIQKETIKLLNSLNNSLTLMSDRLDEFAIKTNMKLDDFNTTPTNNNAILINNASSGSGGGGILNTNKSSNTMMQQQHSNQMINTSGSAANNKINYLLNNNEIIYLTGDILTGATTTTSNSGTNLMNVGVGGKQATNKTTNDVFILNDLNTLNPSLINLDQLTATSAHQNKIFFINNNATVGNDLIRPLIKLDNATLCNGTTLNAATVTTTTQSGVGNINTSKLNSTSNNTSDDSISGEISYDESSNNEIEKESIQNTKKKPRKNNHNRSRDGSGLRCSVKDTEEGTNQQRLFNKFVREKVESRLGKDFLLLHEIQEINGDIMEEIKKEALDAYPPINIRPRRAWHLAKASLRCRRRSLRRQKERSDRTSRTTVVHSVSTSAVSSSAVSSMSPLTPTATSTTNNNATSTSAASSTTATTTTSNGNASNNNCKDEKINLIEPSLIQPQHLTNLSAV